MQVKNETRTTNTNKTKENTNETQIMATEQQKESDNSIFETIKEMGGKIIEYRNYLDKQIKEAFDEGPLGEMVEFQDEIKDKDISFMERFKLTNEFYSKLYFDSYCNLFKKFDKLFLQNSRIINNIIVDNITYCLEKKIYDKILE